MARKEEKVHSEDKGGKGEYWEVRGKINDDEEGGRGACILARKEERVNSEDKGGKSEYSEVRGKINGEEEVHIGKEGGKGA